MVELLVRAGARDRQGLALTCALQSRHKAIARSLIESGAGDMSEQALCSACREGDTGASQTTPPPPRTHPEPCVGCLFTTVTHSFRC